MKHNAGFKNEFNKDESIWISAQGLPSEINHRSMGLYFIEDETERAISRLNDKYISQMLILAV